MDPTGGNHQQKLLEKGAYTLLYLHSKVPLVYVFYGTGPFTGFQRRGVLSLTCPVKDTQGACGNQTGRQRYRTNR